MSEQEFVVKFPGWLDLERVVNSIGEIVLERGPGDDARRTGLRLRSTGLRTKSG